MFLVASAAMAVVIGIVDVVVRIVTGRFSFLVAVVVWQFSLLGVVVAAALTARLLLLYLSDGAHRGVGSQTRRDTFWVGPSLLHRLFFVFSFELASLFVDFRIEFLVFVFLVGRELDHVLDVFCATVKLKKDEQEG